MENKYFVDDRAVQVMTPTGPIRLIECESSALDAVKIPDIFADDIVSALNKREHLLPIAQAVALLGEGFTISHDMAAAAQEAIREC